MNLMYQSLPWWSWLTLLLVPPLIFLLYFLKLRRMPLKVPSTYLWSKAIEDMHVNSFWQRLRKNLLLLLQLLFALMLLLTCLRPGCDGTELVGERFIFLIDNSASMAATDTPNNGTRLEYAKTEIRNSINSMPAGASAMLISFSDSANIQQSYTTSRSELIRKLNEIPQTQKTSDLNEALTAASGLANPGRSSDKESQLDVQVADALDAVLHIYSDGGVRKVPEFSPGALSPEYHAVGSVGDPPNNVGITAFSVGEPSDADGSVQVFARLQNSDDVDRTVSVSFYLGDSLQDAVADILIPAEGSSQGEGGGNSKGGYGSKGISFELTAQAAAVDSPTVVRLEIENDDVFMLDNEAFAVLNPPRKSNVLIVSENTPYFRYACNTDAIKKRADVEYQDADYLNDKEYLERSPTGFYDLVIYDSLIPKTMPQCNTMVWNEVPPGDDWKRSEVHSPTPVFDYDGTHPIMASVKISSLTIINSRDLEGPPGSLSLIGSTTGAIAMLGPREGYLDLVMGFSIVEEDDAGETTINSDWPKKISFPLFMRQVIENLSGVSLFSVGANVQPGDLLTIRTSVPFDKVNVRSPGGDVAELLPQKNRSFIYSQTGNSGVYDVINPNSNGIDQRIAVNLLDPVESDLEVREELELGYSNLERVASQVPKRKEFWPWLLLAGLVLLMAEWIIYNKRVLI